MLFIYFLIAVGISFICSILEAVLLSLTPAYIKVLKEQKPKIGKLLEQQKKDVDKSIGAILTLNTFAHTLGAAGVGSEAVKMFGQEYMFYISAILTILILVFSEIIPKTIGAYYWKSLAPVCAKVIQFLVFITYPLLIVMEKITMLITKDKNATATITKEEIEATVAMGEKAGVLRDKDFTMIENILELRDIRVKDIHTPRRVVFAIDKKELMKSLEKKDNTLFDMDKFKEYSRVPVYDDNIDNIVGVILTKEYFHEYINDNLDDKSDIIKSVSTINENIPISKLLDIFLTKKEHMCIVLDNYDQTEGIVTLEDVLETLLGREIVDELDSTIDMRELAKLTKR
jgi:CBS domain containing-hemolysin-like protein